MQGPRVQEIHTDGEPAGQRLLLPLRIQGQNGGFPSRQGGSVRCLLSPTRTFKVIHFVERRTRVGTAVRCGILLLVALGHRVQPACGRTSVLTREQSRIFSMPIPAVGCGPYVTAHGFPPSEVNTPASSPFNEWRPSSAVAKS